MKIVVMEHGHRDFCLSIPTSFILNRFGAYIAAKAAQKNGSSLTYAQACAFITALKDFKRTHEGWKLVEVESANGSYVEITL